MVLTVWVMLQLVGDRPNVEGDPMSMRGDDRATVSWVTRYGGARGKREFLLMMLGRLELAGGWNHTVKHICGCISRWPRSILADKVRDQTNSSDWHEQSIGTRGSGIFDIVLPTKNIRCQYNDMTWNLTRNGAEHGLLTRTLMHVPRPSYGIHTVRTRKPQKQETIGKGRKLMVVFLLFFSRLDSVGQLVRPMRHTYPALTTHTTQPHQRLGRRASCGPPSPRAAAGPAATAIAAAAATPRVVPQYTLLIHPSSSNVDASTSSDMLAAAFHATAAAILISGSTSSHMQVNVATTFGQRCLLSGPSARSCTRRCVRGTNQGNSTMLPASLRRQEVSPVNPQR